MTEDQITSDGILRELATIDAQLKPLEARRAELWRQYRRLRDREERDRQGRLWRLGAVNPWR